MSVKASSQGQKTLLHPFIHLFICITLCTGAHSGACSVSVPGFLVKQPSKLKFLLGRHLATNSFGLGRLFYKSSRQLQNFRRHGD